MSETDAGLLVQWMRHGRIASHRGDTPLTPEGRSEVAQAAISLAQQLAPGEQVSILHAPTRRTQESAELLYTSLKQVLAQRGTSDQSITLIEPALNHAIRNPDIYVAGFRVELGSSPEGILAQLPPETLDAQTLSQLPFWRGFWDAPDRIGYWVSLPDPPGEDADTVARRLLTFSASLLNRPSKQRRRCICITHSPLMRAFLRRYLLGSDPGEPNYTECIDLTLASNTSAQVHFRKDYKTIMLT